LYVCCKPQTYRCWTGLRFPSHLMLRTSQKPLPIHKFWPIYSKTAPDGYCISPIGDGIGKFWIHRLLVHVLMSLLPAWFARRNLSGLECWNRLVGFRYISQEAMSSYVEMYGKKFYSKMKSPLLDDFGEMVSIYQWHVWVIWSLPLAPTHRDMCPSNTGGRLCHSSQSRPLFCGDGVPLTNEAMVYRVWSAYCTHGAATWW
jgi:hypothetical protein